MNDQNQEVHMPNDLNASHHTHMGPILGILVIVLVIILGGLYLWGGMLAEEAPVVSEQQIINNEPETQRATTDQEILETLSPSDELDAIEADINSTNLDSLDTDMTSIDAELGGLQVQ